MSTQLDAPPSIPSPPGPEPPSVGNALGRAFILLAVLLLVLAGASAALWAWGVSQTTVDTDRSVHTAADEIVIDMRAPGSLTIGVHDADEIIVDTTVESSFRSVDVTESADDQAVHLGSERCDPILFGWLHHCDASYDVTVPADTQVSADLRHGAVELAGITADVGLSTRHGDAVVSDTTGGLHVSSAHGDIDVSDAEGPLEADTNHGRIALTQVDGDAELASRHGNISVRGGSGALSAATDHGSVSAVETSGDLARLYTSHGDVAFHPTTAPNEVGIETSHGSVEVGLPPNTPAYAIQAHASSGTPTIDVPTDSSSDYRMNVTTHHGSIDIGLAGPAGFDP